MTEEEMHRALEICKTARGLKKKLDEFVLLERDIPYCHEKILVGRPIRLRENRYTPEEVDIPESARSYVFNLWRKETAKKYNSLVRELNQLGISHNFKLIRFRESDGLIYKEQDVGER